MTKVAFITGAGRGIGSSIASCFASHGYAIVLHYFTSKEGAFGLSEQIKDEFGVPVLVVQADISDEEAVSNMVKEAVEAFGTIDVLVNNAGMAIDTLYQEKTVQNFRRTLDVNLIGTFLVSRAVGDLMYQQKKGKIINLSSTNALGMGFPMSLDYDASKAGILSLTHNLAIQYAPYVNVNAVAPGWVETEQELEGLDEDYIALEEQKILLHRFGKPEEIAKVIYFLGSADAAYINGEVIRVDGGH